MHYYTLDGQNAICGPFTAPQVVEMMEIGTLSPATEAAAEGDAAWRPLNELLPALRAEFQQEVLLAIETGPPTSPLLKKLLKEDGEFPRPRLRNSRKPTFASHPRAGGAETAK